LSAGDNSVYILKEEQIEDFEKCLYRFVSKQDGGFYHGTGLIVPEIEYTRYGTNLCSSVYMKNGGIIRIPDRLAKTGDINLGRFSRTELGRCAIRKGNEGGL